MEKVVCFGEIMLRLNPPGRKKIVQADNFNINFGGSEGNVAVCLANFGINSFYVTRIPENSLGEKCIRQLKSYGVDTSFILKGGKRIGIYFVEPGAVIRPSVVIYDREGSSFSEIQRGMFNWEEIFNGKSWFHFSGITPALTENCFHALVEACEIAKKKNLNVSCDLNYRKKLWKWTENPGEIMSQLLKYVDVIMCNEEDAEKYFGIKSKEVDVEKGKIEKSRYMSVAERLKEKFNNLKTIGITLRTSINADYNRWSAVLWKDGDFIEGMDFEITHIVDRVGAGDSFSAGLIYGLLKFQDIEKTLNFAIGTSALKHTIEGDFNLVTVDEVEKIIGGETTGRISR